MKRKRKASVPGKIVILVAIVSSILTLISILAKFISPLQFWPIALFGLGFKYFYFVNLLFLIYFIMRKRLAFFIPLIPIVAGFTTAQTIFRSGLAPQNPEASFSFKIISYNVRLFDLYNWTSNLQTRQKILEMLGTENADILCLQEFYTADDKKFQNLDTLLKSQKAKSYHLEYQKTLKGMYHFGIGTFSSFPIVKRGHIKFSNDNSNICIFSDIKIGVDTIRVYNAHMESIRFRREDYDFIDKFAEGEEKTGKKIAKAGNIVKRLKNAYLKRSAQAEMIVEHIAGSPHPTILCGDFNDIPVSYCYQVISEVLTDAYMVSGRGLGNTYTGPFPSFRIDYIFHDAGIQSGNYKTIRQDLSDHYPISCRLHIVQQPEAQSTK